MKIKFTSQLMASVFILSIGITTSFAAPILTDSPQRIEQQRVELSATSEMEVITSIAEYKPGETIELHIHHGIEAAYVIQGAMIQIAEKEPIMLATGKSVVNLRDVIHGGFKVVGETSLKLFTVHIVDKGQPLYDTKE